MDIRDFEIIVQFRVHKLTMCALVQRLGRGARDPNLEAVFLLLVEPKYFERNRKASSKRAEKRRAEPSTSIDQPRKRRRLAGFEQIYPDSESQEPRVEIIGETESQVPPGARQTQSLEELLQQRRRAYASFHVSQMSSKGKKTFEAPSTADLEPPIYDIVNADEVGIDCRRIPINIEFENDKLRELSIIYTFKLLHLPITLMSRCHRFRSYAMSTWRVCQVLPSSNSIVL